MVDVLGIAKEWAGKGFPAFPVHSNSKTPFADTHGHHDATTDSRLLDALFEQRSKVGGDIAVAVVPGRNGYIVIDVDVANGKQGREQFTQLQEELGPLPEGTALAQTRSGGYHIWLKKPVEGYIRNSKLAAHIDIRADGGYVLVPGNDGYKWLHVLTGDEPVMPMEWYERLKTGQESATGRWGKLDWDELDDSDKEAIEYLIDVFQVSSPFRLGNGSIGFCRKGVKHNSGSIGHAGPGHIHIFSSAVQHPDNPKIVLEPDSNWNVQELREYCITKESPHKGPELKPNAFYGPLGEATKLFSHTEADPAAIMLCLLSAYGNMLDGSAYLELVEPIKQYSRVNVLVVGASAKARKSAAWGQAKLVLKEIDEGFTKDNVLGGFGSGHILVDHLSNRLTVEEKEGALTIKKDRRMLIFEDEFVRVLKTVNSDGSIYSAVLRSAFDGSKLEVRSRQKESVVPEGDHHISVLGCITSEELRQTLTNTEAYNGFGNRILYVWARKTKNVARSTVQLDQTKLKELAILLQRRAVEARTRGRIHLDEDAYDLWDTMYDEVQYDDPEGLLGTLIARADVMLQRLALIFALADGAETVKRVHLEAAGAIWKYCRTTAEHIFKNRALIETTSDKVRDRLKAKVYDAIYSAASDGISLTDLKKPPVAANSNKELVQGILEELEDESKVVSCQVNNHKQGKNPTLYFVPQHAPSEE